MPTRTLKKASLPKSYPRSYKLDSHIMAVLQDLLSRANRISPKHVSEARLVKALILLSKDINDTELLAALKEVW